MGIICAQNLSYNYVRRDENDKIIAVTHALKNINIDIEEGEFVAIIGQNGSGKSTFAKLINGLIMPSEGKIFVGGSDTTDKEKIWDVRKTAGMVFQNPDNQIIASVVCEDVAFGPENIGVPSEEIEQRVRWALEMVDMSEYFDASPNRLSGGQKQRIAIAGALAMKPKCIIFDESTAMLDPIGRDEVLSIIKKLNREEKITVILITHYMEEAAMADRVVVLNKGELKLDGSPREVFKQEAELGEYGLELPEVTKLANKLNECGLSLGESILTTEELVERLCR